MKKQTKPYIFFDQNVMDKMSKNQYDSFQHNVKQLTGQNIQRLTPFGLLEFAGLKKHELFDIKYEGKKLAEYSFRTSQEVEGFIPDLRDKIEQKISKEFLISKLQEKKKRDISYLNQWGKGLIDKYISALSEEPGPRSRDKYIYHSIVDNLFLDRLPQINISKLSEKDREKVMHHLSHLILKLICEQSNMGSLRLMCKIFKEKRGQIIEGNRKDIEAQIITICDKIKSEGDLVDCELIHLAFFGSNDKHCYCYTTDKIEDIESRLILYGKTAHYWIYKTFYNIETNNNFIAKKYPKPEWRCGKVFILDKETGENIKKIPVTEIYEKITVNAVYL